MTILDLSDERPIYLAGWGAMAGPLRYSNAEVCEAFGLPAAVAAEVEEKIGTRFRHSCTDLRTKEQLVAASTMGSKAAAMALETGGLSADAVQAVIGLATVPDYLCPSLAVRVQKLLGLSGGLTFDLLGGCGAWGQGMFLAAQLLHSRAVETALVVSAEPVTRVIWTMRRAWEVLAFGDGAAAMVLSTRHQGPFILRRCGLDTVADLGGCRDEIISLPVLGEVLPPLLARSDRVDPELPPVSCPDAYRLVHRADLAAKWGAHYMAAAVEAISEGIDRRELYLCPHQPSRVVLEAVQQRLGLPGEQVALINPEFGNLSSASSPTAFCERFAEGPARHRWTVLAPIGTGLTYGAALLERVGDVTTDTRRPDAEVLWK